MLGIVALGCRVAGVGAGYGAGRERHREGLREGARCRNRAEPKCRAAGRRAGWLEIKGRRYDGIFKVLAIPDATPDVDPQTGAIRLSSFGFESYIFDGGTMYARDVDLWLGNVPMRGQFDIFGVTLSGPAFDQSPAYPTWGTGVALT